MAVSVGTTPERWLQGLDRMVAATAELFPVVPSLLSRQERLPTRWVLERGPVRAAAPVDLLGGYPGSLQTCNRFERTYAIVTERYLVVGEGSNDGFALPVGDILTAGIVRPSSQVNPGLVVQFQDGSSVGLFALNFRGLARGLSGVLRTEEMLRVLVAQGVRRVSPERLTGFPRLLLTWEEARTFADESLVWSGMAQAAVGGWFGAIQHRCRVWLTEESLFWSCPQGDGVNRLPVSHIVEVRDGVADRVRVVFQDDAGYRHDLPLDFAWASAESSPGQQRMRFLNALAASGVAVSAASVPLAPWRRGGTMRPTDRGR